MSQEHKSFPVLEGFQSNMWKIWWDNSSPAVLTSLNSPGKSVQMIACNDLRENSFSFEIGAAAFDFKKEKRKNRRENSPYSCPLKKKI